LLVAEAAFMNWFGDSGDAPVNDPAAKSWRAIRGRVPQLRGTGRGRKKTPHQQYISHGAVSAVDFHGSGPPISDLSRTADLPLRP